MTQAGRKTDDLAYWANAMKRLSRATEATQAAMQPSGPSVDRIFAERAAALATPLNHEQEKVHLELIGFELGKQRIAIESRYIQAVISPAELTEVPGTPDILAGIMNFRGGILPVFRLERVLGASGTERTCMIVLGEHRPEFAFFAQSVEEVSRVSAVALRRLSWREAGDAAATLGVTGEALNVLDGRALLSDPRFFIGRQARLAQEGA